MNKNCAVILAAGDSTLTGCSKPKIPAQVLFVPMTDWVISAVKEAGIEDICVVTDNLGQTVCEHTVSMCRTVLQAKGFIAAHSGGNVLVLKGDTPLTDKETITDALGFHLSCGNSATAVSACVDNHSGYGRIIRNTDGQLERIVGQCVATDEEKKINEVNSGTYWFSCDELVRVLEETGRNKEEINFADAVGFMLANGKRAGAFTARSADIILCASDRLQLSRINEIARKRVLETNMLNGVDIPCTDGVIISAQAVIGTDTQILPGTIITGTTVIGSGCVIGPQSRLDSCTVGDGSIINASQCEGSVVGKNVSIGPFAHLRPGCVVSDGAHAGNFVEIKNSTIGEKTKISHLTYIGDSDFGDGVNVGCGCATANYDGTQKFRTTVGDKAFIGCHTCLVAPVSVGNHAYTAAGSVITQGVPEGTMAIARSRQTIKRKVRKYNED